MPDQHRVMHGHGLDQETVLGNLHAVENERLGEISHGPVARMFMRKPPLDPDVADTAPADSILTPYDHEHAITYLRLLDADAEGADWKEVTQIVLHIDPEREPVRARQAYESHLTRAKWMTKQGYRHLLRSGWPDLN